MKSRDFLLNATTQLWAGEAALQRGTGKSWVRKFMGMKIDSPICVLYFLTAQFSYHKG